MTSLRTPGFHTRLIRAVYLDAQHNFTVSRENDHLYAQLTGQPRFRISPESETRFFYRVVDAQLEFQVFNSGEVEGVKLFQDGMTIEGKKR